jgi:hypothetical protein
MCRLPRWTMVEVEEGRETVVTWGDGAGRGTGD